MSARRHEAASKAAVFSSLLFSSLLALNPEVAAQTSGVWGAAFDHDNSGSNATPYLFPGASLAGTSGEYQPGGVFGWGDWGDGKFNAIHMALIPKGQHRGKVLVWNYYPVFVDVGPTYSQGTDRYWSCQAWSIFDPSVNAPAPRFRNFLLPLAPAGNSPPSLYATVQGADLFCAGHAWSPFGDLVVAGGDRFTYTPPATGYTQAVGAKWLFLFDPSGSSSPFPFGSASAPLYPGEVGQWKKAPSPADQLVVDRYYPTVILTHRLTRISTLEETMIIAGGSVPPSQVSNPGPGGDDPQNTYESYIVRANSVSQSPPSLQQDLVPGATVPLYRGPGRTTTPTVDWLQEYPRLNLLGDGHIFMSGLAPNGVRWDPEQPYLASAPFLPPLATFNYGTGLGVTSVWGQPRIYGSTVLLPQYGALQNVVLRLGGDNGSIATSSSEICLAAQAGASWASLGNVTSSTSVGGRSHSNAVALPDGSILAIGGTDSSGTAELVVARYTAASGWQKVETSPTRRDYHATAMLMPDGSVLIGGGNGRFQGGASPHDYDVYAPWYVNGFNRPANVALANVPQLADGTFVLSPNQAGVVVTASVSDIASLSRVLLIAPGSITHHSDMSTRYIELASTAISASSRSFQVPAQAVAPRSYYMLWVIDNSGVPSKAIWVQIQ